MVNSDTLSICRCRRGSQDAFRPRRGRTSSRKPRPREPGAGCRRRAVAATCLPLRTTCRRLATIRTTRWPRPASSVARCPRPRTSSTTTRTVRATAGRGARPHTAEEVSFVLTHLSNQMEGFLQLLYSVPRGCCLLLISSTPDGVMAKSKLSMAEIDSYRFYMPPPPLPD